MSAHGIGNIKPFDPTRHGCQSQQTLQRLGFLLFRRPFAQMIVKSRSRIILGQLGAVGLSRRVRESEPEPPDPFSG